MQDILYQLLLVVIQVVIVIVGGFVVNYLKTKVGIENLNKYYSLTKTIVSAVEQTFGAGNGADKKAEAVQLIKQVVGNKLTEEQIDSFIEAAVFEMNKMLKNNGISS